MLTTEFIARKRDGHTLASDQIEQFVSGVTSGDVSNAQIAAFAMATLLNGMKSEEEVALTLAMRDSGTVLQWSGMHGPVVDKHSTGGIGDKVSLMLAPMLAACGCVVPMISGRGLGHTGGTLDKLDSIPGFTTRLPLEAFQRVVREIGCAMSGQTPELAPADGRIYAVRDVTATVESRSLIVASILSKKLAEGLGHLVLDVKYGSGAFMRSLADARALATNLVTVANGAGVNTSALITDMNQCLGCKAGNALEMHEAIAFMRDPASADPRLMEVTLALGASLLVNSGLAPDEGEAHAALRQTLDDGRCAELFNRMSAAQGGPTDIVDHPDQHLAKAPVIRHVFPERAGYVTGVNGFAIGNLIIGLGGGRRISLDTINPAVGLSDVAAIGEMVGPDRPLAVIHAASDSDADVAEKALCAAISTSDVSVEPTPLIMERISGG